MTARRAGRPARPRRTRSALLGGLAVCAVLATAVPASPSPSPSDPASASASGNSGRADPAHNDVLFIGAHPDDEYQSLSTFGQWGERRGTSTGVVTITRGEGGGNAAGPEEGAGLGQLREAEERDAVGPAGVRNVFYLDKPDFWYTLSAPLTAGVWDGKDSSQDTLERLVRLIRATTPRTVVTMDPRPFDQHGGHQLAGRLATEAFREAADPNAFPEQLTEEKYEVWQPSRLLAQNAGFEGPAGRTCATTGQRDPATGLPVQGVWSGAWSRKHGTTWAQLERDAQRKYVTQGFASLPETIETPRSKLSCDWFSVLATQGRPVRAAVDQRSELPLYTEFEDWAGGVGMPWLANGAQPDYPKVPETDIPQTASAPSVDGRAETGEYPGEELNLTHWQGEKCANARDCSATARLSRHGDDLYALVDVVDDKRGSALAATDCKRHWRTDSVEVGFDPRGRSDDTSTVFKAGALPFTSGTGGPCAARDADNRQGPAADTAPGTEVASTVTREPYTGYTVELKIPFTALPGTVDPSRLTANVMVYDSDTQDRTGGTRLAWSPYGSAQADPYVWGTTRVEGARPPSVTPPPPEIPVEAAKSSDSPASVEQSRRTGVPLAGGPRQPR